MSAEGRITGVNGVTILLPVVTETVSLDQTVEILLRECRADIRELLIVVCDRTTPESMAAVERWKKQLGELAVVHVQKMRFLGGAVREAFDMARGSHFVMMATDLETNPEDVKRLIAEAKQRPDAVITATRWRGQGGFQGYSPVKLVLNWIFQNFFAVLYWTKLSDLTYGFRLLPTKLVQAIQWEELRHPFLFETILKPMRLGVQVIEIPSFWKARTEGRSQNAFLWNFAYFKTGVRMRFIARGSILKPGASWPPK